MIKTLRERFGVPVLFHVVYYQGKTLPSPTGYMSNDPLAIGDQLSAMREIGGEGCGVIALTYGPTVSSFIHGAVMEACRQCADAQMPFALCFDPWITSAAHPGKKSTTAVDANPQITAALKNADLQTMFASRSYLHTTANLPLVLDFNTFADASAYAGLATPWFKNSDYAWPNFDLNEKPVSLNNNVKLPCAFKQFNDGTGTDRNKQVNDQSLPARIWPANGGRTWMKSSTDAMASTAAALNGSAGFLQTKLTALAFKYIQIPTWNDVVESTDIENDVCWLLDRQIGT